MASDTSGRSGVVRSHHSDVSDGTGGAQPESAVAATAPVASGFSDQLRQARQSMAAARSSLWVAPVAAAAVGPSFDDLKDEQLEFRHASNPLVHAHVRVHIARTVNNTYF